MTAAYHHTGVFSIKNPTIESEVSWSSLLSFYTLEEQSFQQYIQAIAALRSPPRCYSLALPCLFSRVLIPVRISWINPLPCRLESVCTSFGLLLLYLYYLSALPCRILFADRRPTLALGLLLVLPYIPV